MLQPAFRLNISSEDVFWAVVVLFFTGTISLILAPFERYRGTREIAATGPREELRDSVSNDHMYYEIANLLQNRSDQGYPLIAIIVIVAIIIIIAIYWR